MGLFSRFQAGRSRRVVEKAVEKLREMTVGDIMSTYIITIPPDATVIHAATKMIAEDISCLVAMKDDQLSGILTERDFMHKVPLDKKVFNMHVKDIMTGNVVTVEPEMKLTAVVEIMKKRNFRRIVVAKDGKTVGIATQTDFSRAIRDAFSSFPVAAKFAVSEIMSKKVLTASSKETFSKARAKMKKINVGSILIVNKGVPVGIFTEYDVVMQFYDQEGRLSVKELSSYMRKYVRASEPGLSMFEANAILIEKNMRRLPIMSDGKIHGIVTQTDIVRFLFLNLDLVMEFVGEAESFGKCKKEYVGEFKGDRLKVYS